jgi:N-acetylglucosamine kinase-like BadF-type ATPase
VPFFLAIDGGGSKTSCVVGNESSVLGKSIAPGSNLIRVGNEKARAALQEGIQQACLQAAITPSQIIRTCIGLAGGARPEIANLVHELVAEIVPGEIEVVGDMEIARYAAFADAPGVVVIAGTGSIAYGKNSRGRFARAGGWGFQISDEGSGHWIGRSAITSVLRAYDEGENPLLLQALMKAWGAESREKLVIMANSSPYPDFATLLPAILPAADGGDPMARAVLAEAGAELAGLAKIVIRRIFPERETAPVAMAGGVFGNSALVRQVFYNSLRSEFPEVAPNPKVVEPVFGALDLARKSTLRSTGT